MQFRKIKTKIPTTWNEITLREFQYYFAAQKETDTIKKITKTISAFSGLPESTIKNISYSELVALYNRLTAFASAPPNYGLQNILEIDGVKYGFHPNIFNMTLGEFVDLSVLDSDFWPSAHKALAILYRPIIKQSKEKYQIEEYKETHSENANLFLDLPMTYVLGAVAFFLTLLNQLPAHLLTYSEQVTEETKAEIMKLKAQNGLS